MVSLSCIALKGLNNVSAQEKTCRKQESFCLLMGRHAGQKKKTRSAEEDDSFSLCTIAIEAPLQKTSAEIRFTGLSVTRNNSKGFEEAFIL